MAAHAPIDLNAGIPEAGDWETTTRRHVIMFSGGITSWGAAKRVEWLFPSAEKTLLIADTHAEDEDLWRFAEDASGNLGVSLTKVEDGRDPWAVFEHERMLGNSHVAPCSRLLKQVPCRRWMENNTDPADTTVYLGLEWTEVHRIAAIRSGWAPWRVVFPLMYPPFQPKDYFLRLALSEEIYPPRLYAKGFSHNNCGGACVRAGQAAWAHLYKVFPDRFLKAEANEEAFRSRHGEHTILTEQRDGKKLLLPLSELRRRIDSAPVQGELFSAYDENDWGGCGCFTTE